MECSYCYNSFKTKSSLHAHQQKAKYCLQLRQAVNTEYKCSYCEKILCSKNSQKRHENKCTKQILTKNETIIQNQLNTMISRNKKLIRRLQEKDTKIKNLESHIQKLEDRIDNIAIKSATKPMTINNRNLFTYNYIQNMQPLVEEDYTNCADKLTFEHIKNGANGYAKYALENPLNNKIVCTDNSRKKVYYKDKNGDVIADPELVTILSKICKAIQARNTELIENSFEELAEQYKKHPSDESSHLLQVYSKYIHSITKGAEGEMDNFLKTIAKIICNNSMITKEDEDDIEDDEGEDIEFANLSDEVSEFTIII